MASKAGTKKATIVGGGLVGSLWSIYLGNRGYEVDVYERRKDGRKQGFLGGRSINLALSDRGWRALEGAGIRDKVSLESIPMYGRMMHDEKGNLSFQPYGKKGQAIYSVSRGGLNLQLIDLAEETGQVNFHFQQRCHTVDLAKKELVFQHTHSGETTTIHSPLTFGTDGAFSAVRGALQKMPRFNYSQTYLDYGYKELSIPPKENGGHRMEPEALHIWPRGKFMLIALPNKDGSFTCTLFLPFEGEESFEKLQSDPDVLAFFKNYFEDAMDLMPSLLEDFNQNPTSTLATIRCTPWHYQDSVLLLGDASHGIVPFYGQGMNSGFEDCTLLGQMTEEHQEDWSKIIPLFSRNRVDDANAIANLALRNFIEMRDLVADPMFLLRKKIEKHLHEHYPDLFVPVYSMVSFSHIPYRKALLETASQDALFDQILKLDGIKENWESFSYEELLKAWQA